MFGLNQADLAVEEVKDATITAIELVGNASTRISVMKRKDHLQHE